MSDASFVHEARQPNRGSPFLRPRSFEPQAIFEGFTWSFSRLDLWNHTPKLHHAGFGWNAQLYECRTGTEKHLAKRGREGGDFILQRRIPFTDGVQALIELEAWL